MKIKILSPETVAKISAGEVIERPAYVVKELIENSIDAGADEISVRIERSGTRLIEVIDNGLGMDMSDLKLASLPHSTSKITTDEDLTKIKTLGFRGEALASIAAVSKVTIASKARGADTGYLINTDNGAIRKLGISEGSRVTVKNLFSSVPARRKFLKSEQTEYRNILDVAISFALSNNLSLDITHNGRQTLSVDKFLSTENKISKILGVTTGDYMIPVKFDESYIQVNGFTSKPQLHLSTTNKTYLFLNGRRIYDHLITTAIRDAYSNLLEAKRYPVVILYIKVPPELVDVNVHPKKETVRFLDNNYIYTSVHKSIQSALEDNNLTYTKEPLKLTKTSFALEIKDKLHDSAEFTIKSVKKKSDAIQLHNKYLVVETKSGALFLDQHAAHEAILYRKLTKDYNSKKNKSILLKKSQLISLGVSDASIVDEYHSHFLDLGFEIEKFDDKNTYKLTSAPEALAQLDLSRLILDVIESIRNDKPDKNISTQIHHTLAYIACRSAIKTGDKLTKKEIQKLLKLLENQDYLYTCPHGRPVMIEFSLSYLDNIFKR